LQAYTTEVLDPQSIGEHNVQAMSKLYLANYEGTDRDLFLADLTKKTKVVLLRYAGQLVGFTTLEIFPWDHEGHPVEIVYSGDTIVDPAHWGQQALAFAWIRLMGAVKHNNPDVPLYWLLIVKGHRTFKYLSAFGKTFHPHWKDQDPMLHRMADELARYRFGSEYEPHSGVVEYKHSRGHLKAELAEASELEQRKPGVRFFLDRNPHYRQGHELVCLCSLDETNMKPLTRRLFSSGAPS
jgi:hypothetical protein